MSQAKMARRFTDDEVFEILDHHQRLSIAEIGRLFQSHPSVIRNIVTGKTYRHLTHDNTPGVECGCPACRTAKQADANLRTIDETVVTLGCFYCRRPVEVTVRSGLDAHGEIACLPCGGRRRK